MLASLDSPEKITEFYLGRLKDLQKGRLSYAQLVKRQLRILNNYVRQFSAPDSEIHAIMSQKDAEVYHHKILDYAVDVVEGYFIAAAASAQTNAAIEKIRTDYFSAYHRPDSLLRMAVNRERALCAHQRISRFIEGRNYVIKKCETKKALRSHEQQYINDVNSAETLCGALHVAQRSRVFFYADFSNEKSEGLKKARCEAHSTVCFAFSEKVKNFLIGRASLAIKSGDFKQYVSAKREISKALIDCVEKCTSRAEVIILFENYQSAKHINVDGTKSLKVLMCDYRDSGMRGYTCYQDYYGGQSYGTSRTDSLIIKAMKRRLKQLAHTNEIINDSVLGNFVRKPKYTSALFLSIMTLGLGVVALQAQRYFGLRKSSVVNLVPRKATAANSVPTYVLPAYSRLGNGGRVRAPHAYLLSRAARG